MFTQLISALFELIFIFVILAALCHQRERIGEVPAAMAFCAIIFIGIIMGAAEVDLPLPGRWSFSVSQVVIFMPLLSAFLLAYITLGVLRAQRLLLGMICSFLLCIFFCVMVRVQCMNISDAVIREVVLVLVNEGTAEVSLNAVANFVSFMAIPQIYSLFTKKIWRFFRIVFALFLSVLLGALPELIVLAIGHNVHAFPWQTLVISLALIPLLAGMTAGHLMLLEKNLKESTHGALEFLFAFFGSYGRVKKLETDVNDLRNRYREVLRHTAEVVVITDEKGMILEGNIAACKMFHMRNPTALIGNDLFLMLLNVKPSSAALLHAAFEPVQFECNVESGDELKTLSASLSPIRFKDQLLLVLVGRDLTDKIKLAKEKEALSEQLIHSQRMESLGVLAGGIAHDFNNCIHAIMGHADVAGMLYINDPEKISSHLQKISSIAEKAGKLTSQLLGFARKGKYNVVDIDLRHLLDECTGLLDPYRVRGVEFCCDYSGEPVMRGDMVQMQQVVLNLLINALDAVAENTGEKSIRIRAGRAVDAPLKFTVAPGSEDALVEEYLYFSIEDNGCGIDEENRKKIFEPFFTTKPVGAGTGMGLAMVYGSVTHHKGWIQMQSTPGKGTLFCLFFPAAAK